MKHIEYDGYKFTRDDKTGYYLSSKKIGDKRLRFHVYIWIKANGPIPNGYCVHHKDENKDNNSLDNFDLMLSINHGHFHAKERMQDPERYKNQLVNLENIRKSAAEWHSSPAGLEWHKKHYEKMGDRMHNPVSLECKYCHNKFVSKKHGAKYCSISCRNKDHYYGDMDKENRICVICGASFMTNKYRNTVCCSRSCGARMRNLSHCESRKW